MRTKILAETAMETVGRSQMVEGVHHLLLPSVSPSGRHLPAPEKI